MSNLNPKKTEEDEDIEEEEEEEVEEEEEEEEPIDEDEINEEEEELAEDKEENDDSDDEEADEEDSDNEDEDEEETEGEEKEEPDGGENTNTVPILLNPIEKKGKKQGTKSKKNEINNDYDDIEIDINANDYESDEDESDYLQKFDESTRKNIILQYHPEMIIKNNEEIETLSRVVRDSNGNIIDPFHKTLPFITKYEKARVLGERANQINERSPIFVSVEPDVIDGYLIALKEFEERKIPFIIQRPLPNGTCEYWRLSDLEII